MKTYKAPWGGMLMVISILVTLLCVGASVMTWVYFGEIESLALIVAGWLPVVILLGCLPFVVRSYTITDDAILIWRLFWTPRWMHSVHLPVRRSQMDCNCGLRKQIPRGPLKR